MGPGGSDDMHFQMEREMRAQREKEDALRNQKYLDKLEREKWKHHGRSRKAKNRMRKLSRRRNR